MASNSIDFDRSSQKFARVPLRRHALRKRFNSLETTPVPDFIPCTNLKFHEKKIHRYLYISAIHCVYREPMLLVALYTIIILISVPVLIGQIYRKIKSPRKNVKAMIVLGSGTLNGGEESVCVST